MKPLAGLFTAAVMFAAAAATSERGVRTVLRQRGLLARAFLANAILVPALAAGLAHRLRLEGSTGLRNAGLAFLFAEHTFPGTDVPLGVAAYSLLMLPPNFLFATWMRRRARL